MAMANGAVEESRGIDALIPNVPNTTQAQIQVLAVTLQQLTQIVAQMGNLAQDFQAVKGVVDDHEGRITLVEKDVRRNIRLNPDEIGTLYNAVHERAAEVVRILECPEDYRKHVVRIWYRLKSEFGVNSYIFILRKDFEEAMQIVASYDGVGRTWTNKFTA